MLKGNKKYNTEQLKRTEKETMIEGIEEYIYSSKNNRIDENINKNINHIPMIY